MTLVVGLFFLLIPLGLLFPEILAGLRWLGGIVRSCMDGLHWKVRK